MAGMHLNKLLSRLNSKARRGSKPRCHLLTHGSPLDVAGRLSDLIAPFGEVGDRDYWMPVGFDDTEEAELDKADRLLNPEIRHKLEEWWLAPASVGSMTPNFDIASTCTIDGQSGLLLVEAKAHDKELINESAGRKLTTDSSEARKKSHTQIGSAISGACEGFSSATHLEWLISRDSHYQMSNRFAWAWKLTELGVPVVLVYLGFLNANEMTDRGEVFVDEQSWERLVKSHSETLIPEEAWGRSWKINGWSLTPLIRSIEVSLGRE